MDSAASSRIRDAAAEVIARYHVPGISIGVVEGGDLVFCEGFGVADIEAATPMEPARKQCIASITKTMVGLCAMALVDEGRLRLDARVPDLLPDVRFDGPAATMTVRHLLTHTGGIGEAHRPEALAATVNPDADARLKAGTFASMYEGGIVIECEPGTKWHYANHGFNLLGEIVTRAEDGADLHDVMRRRIFAPLGMQETDLLGHDDARLTTPYHRAPTDDQREQLTRAGIPVKDEPTVDGVNIRGTFGGEFNKAALAAGGAQSTVPDMARYASALLRRGAGIVRPETFEQMTSPQYCPDGRFEHWGLAFHRLPFGERTLVGHGGAYFGGWNSDLAVSFGDNVAVIQHMNVMMPEPASVYRHILRAVFDVPAQELAPRPGDPRVVEDAPGLYELTPGRLTNFRPATRIGRVQIERNGDGLRLTSRWGDWKRGVALVPAGGADPLLFAIPRENDDPALIAFTHGGDGRIDGLLCDSLVRMVKRPGE